MKKIDKEMLKKAIEAKKKIFDNKEIVKK